jgi:hypothetical protein
MHACGHDIHMASFIGAAAIMAHSKNTWHGTLMLIAQPAEETISGAPKMIEDGLLRVSQSLTLRSRCTLAICFPQERWVPGPAIATPTQIRSASPYTGKVDTARCPTPRSIPL